jgi:hypothetical protein
MREVESYIGDISEPGATEHIAHSMSDGVPVAVDNVIVHALWGDGEHTDFRPNVARIKGSEANKPHGLTITNHEFLELVDHDRLAPEVAGLFDPAKADELTDRTGAFVFWRLPGRPTVPDNLPRIFWSLGADGLPIVQNWSPEGKPDIVRLMELARGFGVDFPAVTSLNITAQPEITDPADAERFAQAHGIPLLTNRRHTRRPMKGSYPVIIGDVEGLHVGRARSTSIGSLLLTRLLDGYPLQLADTPEVNPGFDDPQLEGLRGSELRDALLSEQWLGFAALRAA